MAGNKSNTDLESLVTKYGGPVPRYTSYPTAPHFHGGINEAKVKEWLQNMKQEEASFYIHMAYCKSQCLYCGCNMKVTNNLSVVTAYVDILINEINLIADELPRRLKLTTLHWGGGTPSYAPLDDLTRIYATLRDRFDICDNAEISMEIDPRQLHDDLPELMGKLGFNRVSLGIQDTNPAVQEAIRRVQPQSLNRRAVNLLRASGIENINVDLLYGLPRQTTETMQQTVADMMELRPQRIALYGYAHVPWVKKHQAVLEKYDLPDADRRLQIFETAVERLTRAGYVAVGIDHFALPSDSMAIAEKEKKLHRNFMGYTTDDSPVMLGVGASAISQYPHGYAQNLTTVHDYTACVKKRALPTARGIEVDEIDVLRRKVIESLLCHMSAGGMDLNLEKLVVKPDRLKEMERDGVVVWESGTLKITNKGMPFTRAVAACFDAYWNPGAGQHSQGV